MPGFKRSCFEAEDETLAHSAELECKVTNLAGTQQSRPDLERVKDVNPDPLWGNPFDSQPSNVVFTSHSKAKNRPISHALVSVLASTPLDDLGDNCMSTFDSNSKFWVCDNSATGHICNDMTLFHGPLVSSLIEVSTATGSTNKLNMGTVVLTLTDDDGVEHTFTLQRVIHMPHSPVNMLSTRKLAEQFPNANGDPDRKGTGVMSTFDEHILFWNNRQHKRHLLPQLLVYQNYFSIVASPFIKVT